MKFIELKQNLTSNFYPCLYLTGQDGFLIQNSKKTIKQSLNIQYEEFNYIKLSNEDMKITDILASTQTLPFMCDKKIVEISIINKLSNADINAINEYLKNPIMSTCLVIVDCVEQNISSQLKNIEVVDCNRLNEEVLIRWIGATLKPSGKQIDIKACEELIHRCNFYLSKIDLELKKLINYIGSKDIILLSDVEQNVSKDFEFQIYELSDAVIKKDTIKAFNIINALKINKDNSNVVVSSLYSSFRRLFYIAINQNLTNAELASFLGCKEYAVKIGRNIIQNYSQKKLKLALEFLAQAELNIKSGVSNKDFNNEYVVLKLLNL